MFTAPFLPITMTANLTPEVLPKLLTICAEEAKKYGCDKIRTWGVEPSSEVTKKWIELGAWVENRNDTRKAPFGLCWYGPEGTQGDLLAAEWWGWN